VKLDGKVAVVTGAAGGIGRAIATRYAAEGAMVIVADRDEAGVREAATAIGRGCHAAALDVTSETSIAEMVGAVVAQNGGIDILVNNAAVFDMGPVLEVTRKSFDRLFDVNVRGLFFTLQAVARQMVERGRGGKIINMASQAGRRGEALVSVYCATKAAVINLTQSAGLDLIKYRINVNGISPGVVDTPMWDEVDALFARPCHSAAWGCRTIMSARPSFWRPPMPTMSSPRLSTSTAAIG
jgi:D-sorbitol dehydrogenase (acceptor)